MALASIILDPNAVAYTDDEIVGKVNAATALITRADAVEIAAILESASEKLMSDTEKTKLGGIAEGAEVNPADLEALPDGATRKAMLDAEKTKLAGVEDGAKDDQTGAEIRDLVKALADGEREIVLTNPVTGEHRVVSVEVNGALELKADYDETPEP